MIIWRKEVLYNSSDSTQANFTLKLVAIWLTWSMGLQNGPLHKALHSSSVLGPSGEDSPQWVFFFFTSLSKNGTHTIPCSVITDYIFSCIAQHYRILWISFVHFVFQPVEGKTMKTEILYVFFIAVSPLPGRMNGWCRYVRNIFKWIITFYVWSGPRKTPQCATGRLCPLLKDTLTT